jgi:two-component system, cell cycle response regulator
MAPSRRGPEVESRPFRGKHVDRPCTAMNSSQTKTGMGPAAPVASTPHRIAASSDGLLGGFMFGGSPVAPAASRPPPQAPVEPAPALRLAVKGLKPVERQLLEGLVKVSQRRTPRLEILNDLLAREADVVVIDCRDAVAMAWAHQRPWLAQRAVIWIDGAQAASGHTLLRRPVQWPILPMVLARALESGPGTAAGATRSTAPAATMPPRAAADRSPHVLVVDDSLAVRAHLRSLLEPAGYDVTDADSVGAAMQHIEQRRFDCVLMDVLMPQVDGYEGCNRIKAKLRGIDAVPVVMLTSRGSPFDRIRGKMAGCDAYLTKPVDPRQLGEVLAQQIATPRRTAAPVAPPPSTANPIPTRRY